jgi:thiamine-phosphate pyrophosphorylase
MRPLPRLHAVTDTAVLELHDFLLRAAAIAAAGPAVAIQVRDHAATAQRLTAVTQRVAALARPPEASVFVHGRADIAAALQLQGLHLAQRDLSAADARAAFRDRWQGWIGVSVHSASQADAALAEGADYLTVGNVYDSPTHPDRPGTGLALVRELSARGIPVIAIGGINPARVAAVREAGAYGVAAISALWRVDDPAQAALALLAPWSEAA